MSVADFIKRYMPPGTKLSLTQQTAVAAFLHSRRARLHESGRGAGKTFIDKAIILYLLDHDMALNDTQTWND